MAFWDLSHMFLMNNGGKGEAVGSKEIRFYIKVCFFLSFFLLKRKDRGRSHSMTNHEISSVSAFLYCATTVLLVVLSWSEAVGVDIH